MAPPDQPAVLLVPPSALAMPAGEIAAQFQVPGRIVALESITTGNVNDTYRVISRTTFSEEQFILQRINGKVFPDPAAVMNNMRVVTNHAHQRIEDEADQADRIWQLPRAIPSLDDNDYILDEDGDCWRALTLIASATSYDCINSIEHAVEAGIVLGNFQRLISDLPPEQLADTLPGFHITPQYFAQYENIFDSPEARSRLDTSTEARRLAKFVDQRHDFCSILEDAVAEGRLSHRPIHGDPKINNIMIDNYTGKGTSIIDLDTVKPGLIHYDFGDCARSSCNPAGEETTDLSSVFIDTDYFAALVKGYLSQAGSFLTDEDREFLYPSVRLITFELGLRFFADYLAGDVYFKTTYDTQNLNRARVQFALCESIEAREGLMRKALGQSE